MVVTKREELRALFQAKRFLMDASENESN